MWAGVESVQESKEGDWARGGATGRREVTALLVQTVSKAELL